MMRKFMLAVIATLLAVPSAFAQNDISVDAPNVVGLDEQFNVAFSIEGEDKPSDFLWEPGEDFNLVWGPQTGYSSSTSIINGKRSKSVQYTYTYILSPKKAGTFTLPAALASVKGKQISSKQLSLEVVSNGASSSSSSGSGSEASQPASGGISSEDIFLKFSLSKTSAVIGEPLTASLKLYQRVDVAGIEGAKLPTFNGFWSQETQAPTNIEFHRETLGDKIYNVALIRSYVLIPQQQGELKIEPAEMVCLVNVRVQGRRSQSIFDDFFESGYRTEKKRISTPAVTVHVRPLPQGAPASFGGGVGKFSIKAELSKSEMKTHEAASLRVTISGTGNVSLLTAPTVAFPPDMDVYDAKVEDNASKSTGGTSGSKTFEFPFIPRSHGDFSIAPIEYSYFDVTSGKYVTLKTEPITFSVAKGSADDAPSASVPSSVSIDRKGVRNLAEDIRYIVTRKPSFRSSASFIVARPLYWILVALLCLGSAVIWFLLRHLAVRRADVAGTKNRRATKMALRRLRLAGDFLKKNLYSAFYEELHKALLGFISDKLNLAVEDLTKENISQRLAEGGVPEEAIDKFVGLVDACEYARYSPDSGNAAMAAHYDDAVNVISLIDSVMKNHKVSAATPAVLMLGLALMLPSLSKAQESLTVSTDSTELHAPQSASDEMDVLWTAGISAYEAGRWSEAASSWENLCSSGVESAQLYYNIAGAYFKAEDYAHAILNYERALKIDPSFKDAVFNLELSRERVQDKIDAVPEFIFKTWLRKFCYVMDSNAWAVISLLMLALALGLGLLYLLSSGVALRRTGFYAGLTALVLALVAYGFAHEQSSDYYRADSAIVMSPVTSVKSSPSEGSAKDLFVLHEGTKVSIKDSVGAWTLIELADGRQGWLLASDIEVI